MTLGTSQIAHAHSRRTRAGHDGKRTLQALGEGGRREGDIYISAVFTIFIDGHESLSRGDTGTRNRAVPTTQVDTQRTENDAGGILECMVIPLGMFLASPNPLTSHQGAPPGAAPEAQGFPSGQV